MIPFTESKLAVIQEQTQRSQQVGHFKSLLCFTPEHFVCGAANVFSGSLGITGGGGSGVGGGERLGERETEGRLGL